MEVSFTLGFPKQTHDVYQLVVVAGELLSHMEMCDSKIGDLDMAKLFENISSNYTCFLRGSGTLQGPTPGYGVWQQ